MARNKNPEQTVKRILDASLKLFMEKGYEHTTIQDIINQLQTLSKGAIYHHFKSKEDIIDAVAEELYRGTDQKMDEILHTAKGTGLEKLQQLFHISLSNPNQESLIAAAPNLLKNPRFLADQIHSGATEVAPAICKLIEEGNKDGSLHVKHPKEAAEIIILLSNIWLNPLVFECTEPELMQKFIVLKELLESMGAPVMDALMMEQIEHFRKLREKSIRTSS